MNTKSCAILILLLTCSGLNANVLAGNPEGFTEPFRQLDLASADAGIVDVVHVNEGDRIVAKQVVAELKSEVLIASLKVADRLRTAQGKLDSATAELKQRSTYVVKLGKLKEHVSPEELEKAVLEKEVAEAQLLTVQEDLEVRRLEYRRIEEEIERRKIRSPIDGVVIRLEKDEGEFVSASQPTVMTIVQLDPLLAVFSVMPEVSRGLKPGQKVKVQVGSSSISNDAVVHYLSPVMDAQSGTVLLKVSIPNPEWRLPSGEKCRLLISGDEAVPFTREAKRAREPRAVDPVKQSHN